MLSPDERWFECLHASPSRNCLLHRLRLPKPLAEAPVIALARAVGRLRHSFSVGAQSKAAGRLSPACVRRHADLKCCKPSPR